MGKKHQSAFGNIILAVVLLATALPLSFSLVSAAKNSYKAESNVTATKEETKVLPTQSSLFATQVGAKKTSEINPISLNQVVSPTKSAGSSATPQITPTTTPKQSAPDNETQLPNGGFQNVSNGFADRWSRDNDAFTLDRNWLGPDGDASILYQSGKSDTAAHLFSQNFIIDSAHHYHWSTYLSVSEGTDVNIYVDEYNAWGDWVAGQWLSKANNFTGIKTATYIPTKNYVRFVRLQYALNPGENSRVVIDAVSFTPTN